MHQSIQANPFRKNGSLKRGNTSDIDGRVYKITRRGNIRVINPTTEKQWNVNSV